MKLQLADTAPSQSSIPVQCAGCLIKIHPLEVDAGIVQIASNEFTIGRDEGCHLRLHDDSVSRCHALIELRESVYSVTDLDSTNGVYVNDEPVAHSQLRAGDRLRFGNQIFKFLDQIEAQYHETAYAMMTRDGLTGAYNKRYFLEVLNRNVERCRRRQRPMALILMDIDHFKQINDRHGHLAGDEVLQELSARIQRITREDEVFARFGGEEFALLICDGNRREAGQLAERCRLLIEATPFESWGGTIAVTISAGVAEYDLESSVSAFTELTDQKLYEAKLSGRNRICH
jgi:diguanylate cyclase (GGDEF)-like protein